MRRASASTNTEPTAIDAAAELLLGGMKARRIDAAEKALASAKQRLADAQAAHEQAAENLGRHEYAGSRTRVLEAREEMEVATSLVENAERQLTKAKGRHPPEARAAADRLVAAQRGANTLRADIDPVLEEIDQLAGELIARFHIIAARVSRQAAFRSEQRRASEALGLPFTEGSVNVPDAALLCAESVLKACRRIGMDPWAWEDIKPSVVIPRTHAIPASRAFVVDPIEHQQRVNRHMSSLHQQALENDVVNRAALRQREQRPEAVPAPVPAGGGIQGRASLAVGDE